MGSINTLSANKLEEMISIPELWNDQFNHSTSSELVKDIYKCLQ